MDNKQKRPYRRRCRGGLPNCKNYIGDYTDVDGVNCCKQCDDYVDQNPYDPYWEQMEESFSLSKGYEELEKNNLLEDSYAYEKAFEYSIIHREPRKFLTVFHQEIL
jgi:hypothetical protein